MIILDHIKPPTPKFVYTPPPLFKTELEAIRYYEKEKEYWVTGKNGLNGLHYYHLTQTKMKLGDGEIIRPWYREDDESVSEYLLSLYSEEKDGFWFTRRGFGKSTWLGTLYNYNSRVFPGCNQAMTSADVKRIGNFFNENLDYSLSGIDTAISFSPGRRANSKEGYMRELIYKVRKDGVSDQANSVIIGAETTQTEKSPTNLSGLRGKLVGIDEAGLHGRLKDTRGSALEITKDGNGKKIGIVLMTGTIELKVPQASLAEVRGIVADQEFHNIKVLFTPFFKGRNLRPDGTSDEKSAIQWWEKECERLDKMDDKTELHRFKKNNPMTVEDALSLSLEGVLPEEVYAQVEEQRKFIENNRDKIAIRTGNMVYKGDGKWEHEVNGAGHVKILERPQTGIEYIAGTDPIQAINLADPEEGSKFVTYIYKMPARTPVARYGVRTSDAGLIARNVIALCTFYNNAKNMIENNAGSVIIDKHLEAGRRDLLAGQPYKSGLAVKTAKGVHLYGYRKTGSERAKDVLHELFVRYMVDNTQNIFFLEFFDDIPNYLVGNTDDIDAFQAVLLLENEQIKKSPRHKITQQQWKTATILVPKQGGGYEYYKKRIPIQPKH